MDTGFVLSLVCILLVAEALALLIHHKNGSERVTKKRAGFEQYRIMVNNRIDVFDRESTMLKQQIKEAQDELDDIQLGLKATD